MLHYFYMRFKKILFSLFLLLKPAKRNVSSMNLASYFEDVSSFDMLAVDSKMYD